MKKLRIAAGMVFCFLTVLALNAQTVRHNTADVVVLMDTSGTVLPYYEAINKRVLRSIISKFVRVGDSFHLLSFSAVPRYEMSQKIDTEADLSRVVSRFMLLYQLGQSADFLSGIHFAEQYMKGLSVRQEKILIVISDGIFNPPASSPYRHYSGEQVKTELAKTAASIRTNGWKVYYVKLPFPSDAVIKDLDGTFYAGKPDAAGVLDRSGVDTGVSGSAAVNPALSGRENNGPVSAVDARSNTASGSGVAGQGGAGADSAAGTAGARPLSSAANGNNRSTAGVNSDAADNGYPPNAPDSMESGRIAEENGRVAGSIAAAASTGSDQTADPNSAGQGRKEYTDVSQAFTENLGIESSNLPEEGRVDFNDTAQLIPQIVFPQQIEISGSTLELPLTVINEAAEPAEIKLQSISLGTDSGSYKQLFENMTVRIAGAGENRLTLRVTLPDSLCTEGLHHSDIRLDMVQQERTFSQAAAVLLTVKPGIMRSLFAGKIPLIPVILLLFICAAVVLILIFRRRSIEPVQRAARIAGRQDNAKRRSDTAQQATVKKEYYSTGAAPEKSRYSEQPANKTDPRDSLNTFSSQTAAAAAVMQQETASQMNYLAQEHSRNTEGRFALLNSMEAGMNRRQFFTQNRHTVSTARHPPLSGMT